MASVTIFARLRKKGYNGSMLLKKLNLLRKDNLFATSNALRILGIIYKNKVFTGPLKVTIDITNKCDMDCIMCHYHSPFLAQEKPLPYDFPINKFHHLISELKKIHVKTILICGEGEPLMHPQITEMVKIAKENYLDVEIMTNAFYLNEKILQQLRHLKIKKILVSLHCADKKIFQKIKPLQPPKNFELISKNLLLIKNKKIHKHIPTLYLINVITKQNYKTIPKIINYAQTVSADKILFKPLSISSSLDKETVKKLIISKKEKLELSIILKKNINSTRIPNNIFSYLQTIQQSNLSQQNIDKRLKNHKISCYIPWVHTVIDLYGNIIGCVYTKSTPLGNIQTSSFSNIWYGKKYLSFRKQETCQHFCSGKVIYPSNNRKMCLNHGK